MIEITFFDWFQTTFYIIIFTAAGYIYQQRKKTENPAYKYYVTGLLCKFFSGIVLTMVYIFYYKGGDTIQYFEFSMELADLFYKNPIQWLEWLLMGYNQDTHAYLDFRDMPIALSDYNTVFFIRIASFIAIITYKSYLSSVIIISWLSYQGLWKLLLLFSSYFEKFKFYFALSILFIPSVVFWGSGFLKDTVTLSATCWFTYNFYCIFVKKRKIRLNIFLLIINAFLIIKIKPYIFLALLPATVVWFFYNRILLIKNQLLKTFASPFLVIIGILIGFGALSLFSGSFGKYSSMDSVFLKAQNTQQDLIRGEQYGNNYYDIGNIDNSITGNISKAPLAIISGLFRPFIWEVNNPVMLFSGIENLFLIIVSIYILFRVGPIKTYQAIFNNPFLFFCFIFSIIFAFSVGLTTANFGALVRYRIPALPFFFFGLFMLLETTMSLKKINKNVEY